MMLCKEQQCRDNNKAQEKSISLKYHWQTEIYWNPIENITEFEEKKRTGGTKLT